MTTPARSRRRTDPEDSEAHAHRRKADTETVLHLHSRVEDCEANIAKLLQSQQQMTESVKKLTENTGRLADVLEAWANLKGFWWTLRAISAGAKIVIPIAAMLGAMWLFVKTGNWRVP